MLHEDIEVRDTGTIGLGWFAKRDIQSGRLLWFEDQDVQLLTREEVMQLPPEEAKLCYWTGENYSYRENDPANHINHSCDANTWWRGWSLFSRRHIKAGEQITMDYATEETTDLPFNRFDECRCGSPKCRGKVLPDDLLTHPELREEYDGHLPPSTEKWLKEKLAERQPT